MRSGEIRDRQTIPATASPGRRLLKTDTLARRPRWPSAVGIVLVGAVVLLALIAAVAPGLLPMYPAFDDDTRKVAAAVIFAASYLGLAIGRIPGLSIDRAGVALVGACLMVASGALPLDEATRPLTSTRSRCCSAR